MFDKIKIERLCNELDRKAMTLHGEIQTLKEKDHGNRTPETIAIERLHDAVVIERLRTRALVLLDVSDTIKQLLAES